MSVRELEKNEWPEYFTLMAEATMDKRAEIEIESPEIGDQIAAEWVALLGITYDPKDDILDVAVDGLDHIINRPRQIYVDEGPLGLARLEVIDPAGTRHIITLREPLMLAAR